ncbi:CHASE3 domain-containing protein, partial [Chryseobacterium sp.]|uniref:CHASE3 domain-containing protein n=2 Tax=unclassified Chryseobacterium TaxID=2593645 RepID=UPI0028999149
MPKKIIRNLRIGVALSLLLLIAGSVASFISIQKQMENRESLLKSKESISLVKDVLNSLLNTETGIRGYQLTGQKNFLEPLDKGMKQYAVLISTINDLNIRDKHQLKLLNELMRTSDIMMKANALFIERRKNGIVMTPKELVQNKTAMDQCRTLVGEFVKYEEMQLAVKDNDLNSSSQSTVLFIIFSAVAAIAVTIFFYIQLKADLIRRDKLESDLSYTKEILEQTSSVAQVGGWEVNMKTGTVFWSQSTKEIHKVGNDFQPDFENAVSFFKDDSLDRMKFLFNRAMTEGVPFDEELQLVRNDGVTIWVRVQGLPEFEGEVCSRVFGIIQDIDAFKKMFLEVTRKEAMMQSFVTDVP